METQHNTFPVLRGSGSPPRPATQPYTVRRRTAQNDGHCRRTISAQKRHVQATVHQQIDAFDTDNIVLPCNSSPVASARPIPRVRLVVTMTTYSHLLLLVDHFVLVHHCILIMIGSLTRTLISFSVGLVIYRKVR